MSVTKDILIETLVDQHPFAVKFLREKGIKCLACGEPIWGTLAESAREKGFSDNQIELMVDELNQAILKRMEAANENKN